MCHISCLPIYTVIANRVDKMFHLISASTVVLLVNPCDIIAVACN